MCLNRRYAEALYLLDAWHGCALDRWLPITMGCYPSGHLPEVEGRIAAMKSAPIIMLAEIQRTKLFATPREVDKPPEVAGPMVPRISLYLAEISARLPLRLRGSGSGQVRFHSWVWASRKHGGPRLFDPTPASVHILFLKQDSGDHSQSTGVSLPQPQ
jgi:hypothetical protein